MTKNIRKKKEHNFVYYFLPKARGDNIVMFQFNEKIKAVR